MVFIDEKASRSPSVLRQQPKRAAPPSWRGLPAAAAPDKASAGRPKPSSYSLALPADKRFPFRSAPSEAPLRSLHTRSGSEPSSPAKPVRSAPGAANASDGSAGCPVFPSRRAAARSVRQRRSARFSEDTDPPAAFVMRRKPPPGGRQPLSAARLPYALPGTQTVPHPVRDLRQATLPGASAANRSIGFSRTVRRTHRSGPVPDIRQTDLLQCSDARRSGSRPFVSRRSSPSPAQSDRKPLPPPAAGESIPPAP